MYRYDPYDQKIVDERVAQFRDQTRRYLAGELTDDEFRPLRLQNGLYIQRHAPMLRVAIPYGTLSSGQMRTLAGIARRHDRGYGHFTTRSNIQFNWVRLEDAPDILAELATVQMHAIQTSGNCIRNITTDPFAGVAADELADDLIDLADILPQRSVATLLDQVACASDDAARLDAVNAMLLARLDHLHVVEIEGRRLLVGTGPSGPPQLISELAELPAWIHHEGHDAR